MIDPARRLGVFGGTFDPIHLGHLDAAAAARRAMGLDEVVFVPVHDPRHRPRQPHASGFHRHALVALGIESVAGYRVSDMELRRAGPSYTAQTLHDLHGLGWRPTQLFFILGADAFAEIATWHDYPRVLSATHFVVVARTGTTLDATLAQHPELAARVRSAGAAPDDPTEPGIFVVETATMPVSSTDIRARLAAGHAIDDLVPAPVAQYIHAQTLYRTANELHGED